ncbi:HesA/MoeB/ThiF family protein [Halomonas halocynthiae]|uniref:HesA/MoeB/ThiF family protein n=1 Tax=Halomonas halocynthiae TaxID=176290 RepID=UPI00040BF9D4|nr:HesA/MoeB/ThiF family protein [Halomonas halocynthiae]
MNDDTLLRYSRHILLEAVGIEGQERLLAARVLIVGAGGLGSPAAMYLAAAGVGQLVLADDDGVELHNLQRQIAHGTYDIDRRKAESAAETLRSINPETRVEVLCERLLGERLAEVVAGVDAVLDCTDGFASRYAINDACQRQGVVLISGAAIRFSGQLAVYDPRDPESPCYACLYPPGDSDDDALSCAENGVIGPLVGVVGSFQALEALKLISGAGTPHKGLSTFDAMTGSWRHFNVPRDPSCPVCQLRGEAVSL